MFPTQLKQKQVLDRYDSRVICSHNHIISKLFCFTGDDLQINFYFSINFNEFLAKKLNLNFKTVLKLVLSI